MTEERFAEYASIDFMSTPKALTQQVIEREGCPIHYWTGGSPEKPAVFCMHGALMDHRMFNAQVPVLIDDYRLIIWDGRGHGKSQPIGLDKPSIKDYCTDAATVLEHEGVDKAILIGQSMGAYVAQHMVRSRLKRVRALVVIGSTPIAFALNAGEYWALQASGPLLGLWPWNSLKPYMARNTAEKKEVIRYAESAMNQVDRKTFLSIWKAVSGAVSREGYPVYTTAVPFLLTHGEGDKTGTIVRDGPRWAASDPNIVYKVIPQAGHNANQDNPEEFNRVLIEFLKEKAGA